MTEEKIIIHSKQSKTFKKTCLVVTVVLFSLMLICLLLAFHFAKNSYTYQLHRCSYAEYIEDINESVEHMKKLNYPSEYIKAFKKNSKIKINDYAHLFWYYTPLIFLLIHWGFMLSGFMWLLCVKLHSKYQLYVTPSAITGCGLGGKRVYLPLDMISAHSTSHFMKTISIATSSGTVKFLHIENYDEISNVLNDLISKRQNETQQKNKQAIVQPQISSADELLKYKQLLDLGIISQEEFEAKKKELLLK